MRFEEFDQFIPEFKKIVLEHVNANLATCVDWTFCRSLAVARERWADDEASALAAFGRDEIVTPEQIVERSLHVSSLSVREVIDPYFARSPGKYFPVGLPKIAGSHVTYINLAGIYLWSPDASEPLSLQVWSSWPAYPPVW